MPTSIEGKTYYAEVARTSYNTWIEKYQNLPIYERRQYKASSLNGYVTLSSQKYWRPFHPLWSGTDGGYIAYSVGDEQSEHTSPIQDAALQKSLLNQDLALRNRLCPPVDDTYAAGAKIIFQNDGYTKTGSYVPWSSLGNKETTQVGNQNPYTGNSTAIWVKDTTTLNALSSVENGQTYWWDRCGLRFLVIPRIPVSQMIPPTQVMAASIREGRILALMATGLTRQAASERVDNVVSVGKGGTGSGKGAGKGTENGSSTSGGGGANTKGNIRTTLKVRGNFGYIGVGERSGSEPQMVQMYQQPNKTSPQVARHIFNPKPAQITYSNLGSDWQDIERAGQIPLVDWKSYKLMTVSFQFIVVPSGQYRLGAFASAADENSINLSIDDDLRNLRAMATRPFPVILYGFDDMLNTQLRYPESDKPRGVEFVIGDMNISAIHRTVNGEINRATIDITLKEVPLEAISLIEMPKLVPIIVKPPGKDDEIEYGERRLFTDDSNVTLT